MACDVFYQALFNPGALKFNDWKCRGINFQCKSTKGFKYMDNLIYVKIPSKLDNIKGTGAFTGI